MTKRVMQALMVVSALTGAGAARAGDASSDRRGAEVLAQAKAAGKGDEGKGDARKQGEALPCVCDSGIRLDPAGTNPEVDALRDQQG